MALTTDFSGSSLPSGWTFESNLAGGSHAVANGRLTLTAGTTSNYDSIFNNSGIDNSIGVRHAVTAGNLDLAVQVDTDIGGHIGWGVNLIFSDGAGGWARWACFKHGSGGSVANERPNFFSASRPTGSGTGSGGTTHNNTSVDTSPYELQSGMPAWFRITYTAATGVWQPMYSTDGFTWVNHVAFTRSFTSTYFKIGFTSSTGAAAAGAIDIGQCVDMTANGGVTDLRAQVPTRIKVPVVTMNGTDGALPPEFVDDSAGGTSNISWTGTALRFTDDPTLNANGAGWARVRYVGTEYTECGMLLRLSNPNGNSSCYGTAGLLQDNPNPTAVSSSGASRTANVVTATVSSGHGLRQGQVINATYTDATFNGTFLLSTVAATTLTWAQTGQADNPTAGTGSVIRPSPIDQYVRGGGYALEINSGPIRRPIRVDDTANSNVPSTVPTGSTQLNETPYFWMKNYTSQYNMGGGAIRMFRLERINRRYRVKEWADAGSLAASLAVEPTTWDYLDGQDEVNRMALGPAFSLSHNGIKDVPNCVMDVFYLQFYEITYAVKTKQSGSFTDAQSIKIKQSGAWVDAQTVKRKSGGAWVN